MRQSAHILVEDGKFKYSRPLVHNNLLEKSKHPSNMPEVGEETLHEYFMVLSVGALVIFPYMCPREKLNAKFREQTLKHIGYTHSFFLVKMRVISSPLCVSVSVPTTIKRWGK